ncbi:MAG TPA: selenide, water dikinase SelD, partial [bacterium]|nr:selenide, water dikinase SelD [bacterium]
NKLITNAGAKPGDTLILTKPLGTGTLMSALKKGVKSESELIEATTSMCTLNNIHDCLQSEDWQYLHAMTDVTGFGLAGHAYQLAKASNVTLTITSAALPRFEHVYETLKTECLTKAHGTNRQYVKDHLIIENTVSDLDQLVFFDPQTSGGLLLSVDEKHAPTLLHKLKAPFPKACVIGQVTEKGDHTLILL